MWMCSASPLVGGWGPGFSGLCGLKRIFGGLAATFSDKKMDKIRKKSKKWPQGHQKSALIR
jgi:hypothetical protein